MQTTKTINHEFISPLIVNASDKYKSRTLPHEQNLNKAGMQVDCARALSTLRDITPAQWDALNALNVGPDALAGIEKLAGATSTKVVLRGVGLLRFIAGGPVPPASGRTFALALGAMVAADCKTRDGLMFAVTGKGNMNSSDGVNLQVARNLQKIGCTSVGSFDTQFSVSFSPDGLGSVFGIGRRGKKNEMPEINRDAPFARAIMQRLAALTEIEISDIRESLTKGDTTTKGDSKPPKAKRTKGSK